MAFFPKININRFTEDNIKPILKVQFQGGYEQRRAKNTRVIKKFHLGFSSLTIDEAKELEDFIISNQGLSFTFTHPLTKDNYEVVHEGDVISFSFVSAKFRSTELVLKEV